MANRENSMRPLDCVAHEYAWGRLGSSSTVARMKEAQALQALSYHDCDQQDDDDDMDNDDDDRFYIDETAPYAELWLGTHPSGMSQVSLPSLSKQQKKTKPKFMSLVDYVQTDPHLHCGSGSGGAGGAADADLSFLLKILSVRTVLSIQAHPDKALAEKLHAERPHVYKDPNHKPEMAISLSERCRAMCGFRPLSEIASHVMEYPEFKAVLGDDIAHRLQSSVTPAESKQVLRDMFDTYMNADKRFVQDRIEAMIYRLKQIVSPLNDVQRLLLQVAEQFPQDTGIFSPLILNLVELRQGEALFIDANEPHAYVSGEMIECMACSDNVVRAGLTPKLVDVPTLVEMLTYKAGMPAITTGTLVDSYCVRYQPPVPDFCVEIITVPAGQLYELITVSSPSVLLTLDGEATLVQNSSSTSSSTTSNVTLPVSFGLAVFFSTDTTCQIVAGPYGVQFTRAFSNVYYNNNCETKK